MAWTNSNFLSLKDLYVAYRKAKFDMFYERDHVTAQDFCAYEESLDKNLSSLFERLNKEIPDWPDDIELVGSYTYVPKSLERTSSPQNDEIRLIDSDPESAWLHLAGQQPFEAKFRLVGRHSIDFHVVSALWIQKVGYIYDAILTASAYGSRLKGVAGKKSTVPNETSLGNFKQYAYCFKSWRQNGLDAVASALEQRKSVVVVTADLRRFYHQVDCQYLIEPRFLAEFGIELTEDQKLFSIQLIRAIKTWAANTPDHQHNPSCGLPVGLSAPRVIANVILAGFDRFIERDICPIYYGRYVDDVLLVLDNQRAFKSDKDVWNYLVDRSKGILDAVDEMQAGWAYQLKMPYASGSNLFFAGEKQRVFILSGSNGKSLLDSISRTLKQTSSDWRLLPDLSDDTKDSTADFVVAGKDAAEEVDNLRKSDGLSVRRLAFALRLRNFEAVQRDLNPDQWKTHRDNFFNVALNHMVTVPGLFAYGPYLSRLIGLAVACGDWEHAICIVRRLKNLFPIISQTTQHKLYELEGCKIQMLEACLEATIKAIGRQTVDIVDLERLLKEMDTDAWFFVPSPQQCLEQGKKLYACDLARESFREALLDGEEEHKVFRKKAWNIHLPMEVGLLFRLHDIKEFLTKIGFGKKPDIPRAFLFPTRPLTPAEITLLDQESLSEPSLLQKWVMALNGTWTDSKTSFKGEDGQFVEVPYRGIPSKPLIAVPCFKTEDSSWRACIVNMQDPDNQRYFRLNKLINDVLQSRPLPHYLILPELALPRRWFDRIAHKLAQNGISLVAGLEYLHFSAPNVNRKQAIARARLVSNQVRASLVTDQLGYQTHVIYVQEKENPALKEEEDLKNIAGISLQSKNKPRKPVIRHGKLHFGILICSELTNLDHRQKFRGNIDALFVPEWNKDTNSFSALVEASSLDIHCYVVQVNNRSYGDCRIRAPFQESYLRDVVRVTGGKADYFVVGEIDIAALRAFQSNFRSPGGPYKPVPDGFSISQERKTLPN